MVSALGEKRLHWRILIQALRGYQTGCEYDTAWLLDDDYGPTAVSARECCSAIGLSVERLRERIRDKIHVRWRFLMDSNLEYVYAGLFSNDTDSGDGERERVKRDSYRLRYDDEYDGDHREKKEG